MAIAAPADLADARSGALLNPGDLLDYQCALHRRVIHAVERVFAGLGRRGEGSIFIAVDVDVELASGL